MKKKNTYQLIAVRYREKEEDGTMRKEFPLKEEKEAITFKEKLENEKYAFVEMKTIEIEYGGAEIKK